MRRRRGALATARNRSRRPSSASSSPPQAASYFRETVARAHGRIGTGFIGTPALLPALVKIGEPDLAAAVFLQEGLPGWLFQVKMGATTIWERWNALDENGKSFDPQMNSYNHYAYGAVCQWLFEGVAGFRPDPEKPAFANVIFEPTLKVLSREGGAVQFDLEKFIWLGTPVQEPQVMMVSRDAPATTLEQMKTTKVVFGSSGVGTDNYTLPQVVNKIWGTRNEVVLGYKGPTDIFLALERGEVQGVSAAMSTLLVNRSEWLRDGRVALLMQFGLGRARELPDLPTAIELAPNEESRDMLRFIGAKFALARPFVLPPETPPARVKILREAYEATLKDPDFLADARKIGLEIAPIDGDAMTKMIHAIQTTPAATIGRLRAIINP